MSKKLNTVISEELLSKIDRLAKEQQRTRSNTVSLLLAEALKARGCDA